MVPLWFFSAVLLSSALGAPVFLNNTRNGTSYDDFSSNISSLSIGDQSHVDLSLNISSLSVGDRIFSASCPLPLCSIHDLDRALQSGDEKAGNKVHDPYGPGKK